MRNTFRLRASQRAVSDEQFVRLFAPRALDLIDELDDPWHGLVILRSAPGCGKTSFLRLLTPRPLRVAAMLHDDEKSKPTYDALRKHGALDENGPTLLGAMTAFTSEYRDIEDFDVAGGMFRELLNARIVISTIRAVLERTDKAYPEDLETIETSWEPDTDATIPARATGKELFEWASQIEREFYDRLDELGSGRRPVSGHTKLDGLSWFARAEIRDSTGLLQAKRVLLLDDLQFLSDRQRTLLIELLTASRHPCGIWIAERMEALGHREMLSEGVLRQRDFEGVIHLEKSWDKRKVAYRKFVAEIAELRSHRADGFEDREFLKSLAEHDDPAVWDKHFNEQCEVIERRIVERTEANSRYVELLAAARESSESPPIRARRWRATEILIEIDLGRAQGSFDFEVLSEEDSKKKMAALAQAADLFLRKEMDAPIYFGSDVLADVSSNNVDQYVEAAGDLFDEVSAKQSGPRIAASLLSVDRQHAILKGTALRRWEGLTSRLPRGYDARRFLEAICTYCQRETYRPTAPYAPGVTGFGITMKDRARLIDDPGGNESPFVRLREILASLVAHNLVTPRLGHKNKGKEYAVFYLNRLLCVHYDLPVGHGGWRPQSLIQLSEWVESGRVGNKGLFRE